MADLDIVIVNWNTGAFLRECIASADAVAHVDNVACAIYVVDNGSTDNSALDEISNRPELTLVRNARNEGFGAACNQGAFAGSSKFILFLNPDTRVQSGAFKAALAQLTDAGKDIGIVGIRMIDETGQPQISCARRPTPVMFLADATGLSKAFPSLGIVVHDMGYETNAYVDQVIGAFFLIRRSSFEMLCGFDERFFVYMDEVDLAKRAADKGLRSYFLADATCYHKGNAASDQVKAKRLSYSMMSRCQYSLKHFSLPSAVLVILFVAFCEPCIRAVQSLLRLSPGSLIATVEGTLRFYGWTMEKLALGRGARKPWWA